MGNEIAVNIMLNGATDPGLLAAVRASPTGNTLLKVPLFDCLDGGRRQDAINGAGTQEHGWKVIAEWPAVVDVNELVSPLVANTVVDFADGKLDSIVAVLGEIRDTMKADLAMRQEARDGWKSRMSAGPNVGAGESLAGNGNYTLRPGDTSSATAEGTGRPVSEVISEVAATDAAANAVKPSNGASAEIGAAVGAGSTAG
ncbi:MAG: hypothetical protein IT435_15935 [Phycisphaerales bacterium]|nr:hypothetical protein [Phycisphaerales bacterium]